MPVLVQVRNPEGLAGVETDSIFWMVPLIGKYVLTPFGNALTVTNWPGYKGDIL